MPDKGWQRSFDDPIPLPNGRRRDDEGAAQEYAEIGALPGEVGKQSGAPGNRTGIAAGVDNQIAVFRLRPGSAQRTVQRDMAGLLQDGLEAKFVGDG